MCRKTFLTASLILLLAVWALGCSSPSDPAVVSGDGDLQPEVDPDPPTPTIGVDLGEQAPDFTLSNTASVDVTLSDLRGKPVLLYFWASWCPNCTVQSPRIQGFHETFGESLTVLSINVGESAQRAGTYLSSNGWTFPCVLSSNAVVSAYNVYAIPDAVLLDADGLVIFNGHPGNLTEAALRDELLPVIP